MSVLAKSKVFFLDAGRSQWLQKQHHTGPSLAYSLTPRPFIINLILDENLMYSYILHATTSQVST